MSEEEGRRNFGKFEYFFTQEEFFQRSLSSFSPLSQVLDEGHVPAGRVV